MLKEILPSSASAAPGKESEALKKLTETIIGCAIEVHRQLGPGLLEQTYEAALCIELQNAGLIFVRQAVFPVIYKVNPLASTDLI